MSVGQNIISQPLDITSVPSISKDGQGKSNKQLLSTYGSFDLFNQLYKETAKELEETIQSSELGLSIKYLDQMMNISDNDPRKAILNSIAKKFQGQTFILDIRDKLFICFSSFREEGFIDTYNRGDIYPSGMFSKLVKISQK